MLSVWFLISYFRVWASLFLLGVRKWCSVLTLSTVTVRLAYFSMTLLNLEEA